MFGMQLLDGVLVALAVLVGAAIALSAAILAVSLATRPGQAPQGGIRRDPPQPQPQPDTDDARVLVLR